jgi:two-component system, OmpR family, response regulator
MAKSLKEHKILWIEDDYRMLLPLIAPLRDAGFLFDFAVDEISAMQLLKRTEYNLIILDIIIPEGVYYEGREPENFVGLRLAGRIRNELRLRTPILVLSVIGDERIKNRLKELGINDFLSKGRIMPSELMLIVKNLVKE